MLRRFEPWSALLALSGLALASLVLRDAPPERGPLERVRVLRVGCGEGAPLSVLLRDDDPEALQWLAGEPLALLEGR